MSKITIDEMSDSLKNYLNQQMEECVEDKFSKKNNTKYETVGGYKEFSCVDGYVDNMVIEGETLVNLIRTNLPVEVWDNNRHVINLYDCYYIEGTYTLFNFSDKPIVLDIGYATEYKWSRTIVLDANKVITFNINNGERVLNVNGLFTGGWENNDTSKNEFRNSIVLLEGDHTDKPISYFEGLKSVGQGDKINVLTIDGSKYDLSGATYATGFFDSTGGLISNDKHKVIEQFLEVEEGKTYVLENIAQATCYYDANKNIVHYNIDTLICNSPYPQYIQNIHHVFYSVVKIPKGVKYIRVSTGINSVGKINIYKDGKYDHKQVSTTLRSLPNGVKDTIEKRGSKYYKIQRCGEMLIKTQDCASYTTSVLGGITRLILRYNALDSLPRANRVTCNAYRSLGVWENETEEVYLTVNNDLKSIVVKVLTSALGGSDIRTFVDAKNIRIVYELENPQIIELPNFNLQTYEGDTTLFLNTGAIQGECTFEVTNDLSSEIETLKDKVSGLDSDVNKDKITVYSMDLFNGVEATGNNIYGVLQYNDCAVLTAELKVTTELTYGKEIGKLHVVPKRAFYPIQILITNSCVCVEGWLYADGIIRTLGIIPAGTIICFTAPILI